jgi:Ca-activated chloride channel family protein
MISSPAPLANLFASPALLPIALVLPAVVVLLLIRRSRDRLARLARLGTRATVVRLLSGPESEPVRRRAVLLGGATLLGALALAGPRWGMSRTTVQTTGADVVIAIDASLSMLAPDEHPNRLERAKQEVRRWRDLAPGDRTALLAFAGRSYILTPLTADDGAIDLFLDNLDPSVVGEPGTSLARAIKQGTDLLLSAQSASDRAIVLMSDGEGFEDAAAVRHEAERAAANGISLITVGFGTEAGSTIPLPAAAGVASEPTVKRDLAGQTVITRYTPTLLAAAAQAAHGTFIPASATDKAARIHRALASLRTAHRTIEEAEDRTPRFQLFLVPAVLLLMLDSILVDRPRLSGARRLWVRRSAAAAAAAAAAALVAPAMAHGQVNARRDTGRAGTRYQEAVQRESTIALYARAIAQGDHTPRTLYNYGTALLAADSIDGAVAALTTVAQAPDAELRYRALFNLGLARLRRGLAEHTGPADTAQPDFDAALDAYKRTLLLHPSDRDAAWNYELALRHRHEPPPARGGGGGGGAGAPSPAGRGPRSSPEAAPTPQTAGALDRRQAQELLNSAAREERDVAGQSQKQNATEQPAEGKDW